jgi:hypothetical protein
MGVRLGSSSLTASIKKTCSWFVLLLILLGNGLLRVHIELHFRFIEMEYHTQLIILFPLVDGHGVHLCRC